MLSLSKKYMKAENSLTRRRFIKSLAATGLGSGILLNLNAQEKVKTSLPAKGAKNLILMVSDGMNNGTFSAANHWLKLKEGRESHWMQLYRDGLATRRLTDTACADCLVTDSAAASSAWGIGHRVNMASINVMPDGSKPTPIAILAKNKGKSAGMVSTARITHATPAAFAANVPHRDTDPIIAEQYFDRRIDLLLGGGDKHFNPKKREDKRDLYGDFSNAGYGLMKTRDELLSYKPGNQPVIGIFADDHIPYAIDRKHDAALAKVTPSLEEMTDLALRKLSQNKKGFVLQIEAARVDHAGHANDPASIIMEQLEFDRTIAVVRKFAELDGDTLVVVTTDHGTGGFMLNGADDGYDKSEARFLTLDQCKGSFSMIEKRIDPERPRETLIGAVESTLNIQLKEEEKAHLLKTLDQPEVEAVFSYSRKSISVALRPILFDRFSVSWTSGNHTADLVELAMFGPGSDILPGYTENWELHGVFRQVLGV